ncbi:MAG TPA: hypothetical protein VM736_00030, partial [Gemmatimonadales bacterium]|nr:hypothetical protein [Gemmatimonadales bacterium]
MAYRLRLPWIVSALLAGTVRLAFGEGFRDGRGPADAAAALRAYASAYTRSASSLTPTYARQTGLACSACHTHFPELTATGRAFKLNGYVFRRSESLEGKTADGQQSLLL